MSTLTLFTIKDDNEVYFVTSETEIDFFSKIINKLNEDWIYDFIFNKNQIHSSLEVDIDKLCELYNIGMALSMNGFEGEVFRNFIIKSVAFRFNGYVVYTKDNVVEVETEKDGTKVYFDRSGKYVLSELLFYILKDTH